MNDMRMPTAEPFERYWIVNPHTVAEANLRMGAALLMVMGGGIGVFSLLKIGGWFSLLALPFAALALLAALVWGRLFAFAFLHPQRRMAQIDQHGLRLVVDHSALAGFWPRQELGPPMPWPQLQAVYAYQTQRMGEHGMLYFSHLAVVFKDGQTRRFDTDVLGQHAVSEDIAAAAQAVLAGQRPAAAPDVALRIRPLGWLVATLGPLCALLPTSLLVLQEELKPILGPHFERTIDYSMLLLLLMLCARLAPSWQAQQVELPAPPSRA
ncbi:hypothetical protein CK626_07225 [Vandammella animalimorsus]|nr:hypothetical protein CK626_07225 [Vandammella animalimorsus]